MSSIDEEELLTNKWTVKERFKQSLDLLKSNEILKYLLVGVLFIRFSVVFESTFILLWINHFAKESGDGGDTEKMAKTIYQNMNII